MRVFPPSEPTYVLSRLAEAMPFSTRFRLVVTGELPLLSTVGLPSVMTMTAS